MKNITGVFVTLAITLILSFGALSEAQAKRFGGGGNFGGRSSYSAPYQRSAPSQQSQTSRQQPAAQPGQPVRQGWANRGLMGMLGGLALGGLLGSMFMGGGFHGLNFMDILVFGGIAFLLFKMFAGRKTPAPQPAAYGRTYDDKFQNTGNNPSSFSNSSSPDQPSGGFNTDMLFDKNKPTSNNSANLGQDADFNTAIIPTSFDRDGFLNGAKIAYTALQNAWDSRDLAEIRGLTTDKVFAEIQDQIRASTEENHTDILKINAEVLEVREIGNQIEAVVLFDNILREAQTAQANQVREVWHFIKPNNPAQTKWLLDGIQQLED
jgi:predicted lipid-binding transport protein (Tim44 family)